MTSPLGRRHLFLMGAALAACGPEAKTGPNLDRFPPYEGELAQSFDDSIEPSVFNLTLEARSLQTDPKFAGRVRGADTVATVRITTVTVQRTDGKATYTLQFEPVKVHTGELDPGLLELRLTEKQSQAYSVLSAVQARAQKVSMVATFKRFREQNRAVSHFYFAPDNADTTKALQDALALGALRTQP
jgi:hypothetical protein